MKSFTESYIKQSVDRMIEQNPGLDEIQAVEKIMSDSENYIQKDDLVKIVSTGEVGIIASISNDGVCLVDSGIRTIEAKKEDVAKFTSEDSLGSLFFKKNTYKVEAAVDKTSSVKECIDDLLGDMEFDTSFKEVLPSNDQKELVIFCRDLVGKEVSLKHTAKFGVISETYGDNGYIVNFSDGSKSTRWLSELNVH